MPNAQYVPTVRTWHRTHDVMCWAIVVRCALIVPRLVLPGIEEKSLPRLNELCNRFIIAVIRGR